MTTEIIFYIISLSYINERKKDMCQHNSVQDNYDGWIWCFQCNKEIPDQETYTAISRADSKYKNALSAFFPADLMEFIFTEYKAKRQLSEVL